MNLQKLYWNRPVVYAGFFVFGAIMLIDAVPQYTQLHGELKKTIDPVLDAGLWQGSWDLFAPTPDHVNTRIGAHFNWADGSQTTWLQPDWHEMSAWEKMRNFRIMAHYDGIWLLGNSLARAPFCEYLAKHEAGDRLAELEYITLFYDRDDIPVPDDQWREAYSAPRYRERSQLHTWFADE